MNDDIEQLILKAVLAKQNSYSPYSNFQVGAALLTDNGKIYTGTNVECSSQSPTICAERVAMATAVAKGERAFQMIAVAGDNEYTYPCGVCRQFISEFCDENFKIIVAKDQNDYKIFTLNQLLPHAFSAGK